MAYPFENHRVPSSQAEAFRKLLPHVWDTMPEFSRALGIAYKSIEQKNLYGQPLGIRQDLGIDTSLKLLVIACFNDRLISAQEPAPAVAEKLRALMLAWYGIHQSLQASLFFVYYFYTMQATALYVLKDLLQQVRFVVDVDAAARPEALALDILKPSHSAHWYKTVHGVGDKLWDVFVAEGDYTKTDLPRPGYVLHFKKSHLYDLRAPLFVTASSVEEPVVNQGKVVMSCPSCGQKCRGPVFSHLEIKCPKCAQIWRQRT